jgi:TonB family protein
MLSSALRVEDRPEIPTYDQTDAQTALQVRAVYKGVLIGTRLLPQSRRRGQHHGLDPKTSYVIGDSPGADAPAPHDLLGGGELRLVSRWGDSFLVSVTPSMTGDVSAGGKVYRLADYVAGRGNNFTLPPDGHARIDCGAMSFRLDCTTAAKQVPRRWFGWNWQEQKFTLGSVLAVAMILALSFAIPPDGATASGELVGMSRSFLPFVVKAPEPDAVPEIATGKPDTGGAGQKHVGESGKSGDPKARRPSGALAIKGDGTDIHTGKADAAAAARNYGILGILNSTASSQFADIFGRGIAAGDAAEDVLGNLSAGDIAAAYGAGGFGVTGTGPGGGGHGLQTMGIARFGTLGGNTYGTGHSVAGLGRHIARPPVITQGIAHVKGSLDKEIIRRVIRAHMNEVKYCYEKELVTKPRLEGRVAVQFLISGAGQVLSSVLQSSTMGNVPVEKCVIDAVKRWEFPKPDGGGIAIVSYPFNFVAGSGG